MSDLYDMSDDDLEAAFKAAKAERQEAPDTSVDDDTSNVDDSTESTDVDKDDFEDVDDDNSSSTDEKNNDGTEQLGNEQDSGPDVGDGGEDKGAKADDPDKDQKPAKTDTLTTEPTVHKFKANGKEYEITDEEMRSQFPKVFGQAMDYTKKMQQIAPWRKTIDAIESAKLSHEDVNLAIDVLKGDKAAIAQLLKRTGVDALDLNTDASATYTPNDYGRDSRTLALQDVLDSIKVDPEYAVTGRVLTNDWDEASWNTLSTDPEKIRLLHNDVKSGVYAKVQRIAEKLKVFDGGRQTDFDYYMTGARQYYTELATGEANLRETATANARAEAEAATQARIAAAKAQETQRKVGTQAAQARKAAAPSATASKPSGSTNYLDASEEDFEEWYKRING